MVVHQLISSYGLHITTLGFSDATYGALLSLNGALVVLFELPLTIQTRRFPARQAMAAGYLLMGTALVLNAAFHGLAVLVIGMIIFTLGEMIFAPLAGAYVSKLAPLRMRGRYMGAWAFSNSLSLMLAPSLGMMVYARNPTMLWLGCGALAALAALTLVADGWKREQPLPDVVPLGEDG